MSRELGELQAWVVRSLRSRRTLVRDDGAIDEAARLLQGSPTATPVQRLEIYREQFWLRHTASLIEDFPGVARVVGRAAWEALVEGYLELHPPRSWSLRDLGRHFPEHVASTPHVPERALAHDMARYEWQLVELFDAPDAPPLDPAALGGAALEDARLALRPALALLRVEHPVAELRKRLLADDSAETTTEARREHLVLYRDDAGLVRHQTVSAPAFALLAALQRGSTLIDACASALEAHPDAAAELEAHVARWFGQWHRLGWIVKVTAP